MLLPDTCVATDSGWRLARLLQSGDLVKCANNGLYRLRYSPRVVTCECVTIDVGTDIPLVVGSEVEVRSDWKWSPVSGLRVGQTIELFYYHTVYEQLGILRASLVDFRIRKLLFDHRPTEMLAVGVGLPSLLLGSSSKQGLAGSEPAYVVRWPMHLSLLGPV